MARLEQQEQPSTRSSGEHVGGTDKDAGLPMDKEDWRRGTHWLFSCQQMRLSLEQMGIYDRHRSSAEELDEDFSDNFS